MVCADTISPDGDRPPARTLRRKLMTERRVTRALRDVARFLALDAGPDAGADHRGARSSRSIGSTAVPRACGAGYDSGIGPSDDPSRPQAPQFPAVRRRTAHLADWHLDADRGRVLAGLPADRVVAAAWHGRVHQPDPRLLAGADWRHRRRPHQPPPDRHRHAVGVDGGRGDAGSPHPHGHYQGLAGDGASPGCSAW